VKVLLADDDRVLTHLLSAKLRWLGVEIFVAHDAMQVLMSAMRSPPDAIVLDVHMRAGPASRRSGSSRRRARHPRSR
jgi:DNA-binding response OmpR family regulator